MINPDTSEKSPRRPDLWDYLKQITRISPRLAATITLGTCALLTTAVPLALEITTPSSMYAAVRATDEARTDTDLENDLQNLPDTARELSVEISFMSHNKSIGTCSGMIVSSNQNDIYHIATAAHCMNNGHDYDELAISQPQFPDKQAITVSRDNFAYLTEGDFAALVINSSDTLMIGNKIAKLGSATIFPGEIVYALQSNVAAQRHKKVFPSQFAIRYIDPREVTLIGISTPLDVIVLDGVSFPSGSGSVVVNEFGSPIGTIAGIDNLSNEAVFLYLIPSDSGDLFTQAEAKIGH